MHYIMGEKRVIDTIFRAQAKQSKDVEDAYSKIEPKLITKIGGELQQRVNDEVRARNSSTDTQFFLVPL